MLISAEGTGKCRLVSGRERMEHATVLLHCSLLRNLWSKPTGVLQHCGEGEINYRCTIFPGLPANCIPKVTKVVNVNVFTHSSNYLNYTSDFRELFEVTTYVRTYIHTYIHTYRVIQEESALLWEMIVWVILSKKVHTNMGPILNGYGVKGIF